MKLMVHQRTVKSAYWKFFVPKSVLENTVINSTQRNLMHSDF